MMYVIQAVTVIIIAVTLGMLGRRFVWANKESMLYVFEDLKPVEERSVIFVLTYVLLLVRYLPLDVIFLVETHKMI